MPHALVVDDDASSLALMAELIAHEGFTTATTTTLADARTRLAIGHLDVLTELAMSSAIGPNTRYIAPITAWLRYWVNGDQDAKSFFAGMNCKMCSSPWSTPEPNDKWKALML